MTTTHPAPPDFVDPLDLVEPARFARNGYPHEVWTRLRAEAPVAYFEPDGFEPFWAVTKHADIQFVASHPTQYSNEHGLFIAPLGAPIQPSGMVVTVDPPRHGPLRQAVMRRFTPRAVRSRYEEIDRITVEILDAVAANGGGEFDFVERIAAPLPIAVISWMLGVPPEDWQLLFHWTNEVIGKDDPEFRRPGQTAEQSALSARKEMHAYLGELLEARRRDPRDDLLSHLLVAKVNDEPLSELDMLLYAELMVEAGNETTRNAISGGLLAFSEYRDQWEKLRANPDLVPNAVEEVLRWVTPIIHFTRMATEDGEVRDQQIRAGEKLALIFASGNRDEDVFEDPFAFQIDRNPNPHLTFGFGTHFCMGAHVGRVELETVLRHLIVRLDSFEVTGPIERLSSNVNGGIKHLPVRCRIT
jgi:cholest-4-en-3-one 26-monooxygenase